MFILPPVTSTNPVFTNEEERDEYDDHKLDEGPVLRLRTFSKAMEHRWITLSFSRQSCSFQHLLHEALCFWPHNNL